jgi:hypothetical protein
MKNLIAGFSLGLTGLDTQTTSLVHRFMMASPQPRTDLLEGRRRRHGAGLFVFAVAFTAAQMHSIAGLPIDRSLGWLS